MVPVNINVNVLMVEKTQLNLKNPWNVMTGSWDTGQKTTKTNCAYMRKGKHFEHTIVHAVRLKQGHTNPEILVNTFADFYADKLYCPFT